MRKIFRHRILLSKIALFAFAITSGGLFWGINTAQAASLTSMSDTMSRLKASTASDHEIKFVTPTGLAASGNITLTFSGAGTSATGFTGIASMVNADFDLAEGSTGVCSSATFTEKSVSASPSTSQFSVAGSGQVVTVTSGGASATLTAGRCIRLRAGLNAIDTTGSGPGTHQISNGLIGNADTIAIAGGFGDTGTMAVDIISNDQVTISATVDPTITFTLTNNSVGFGTLSSSTGRWATSSGSGNPAADGTDPTTGSTANTLTVATNATSGYVVSYNGALLTSGANTIAAATISTDSDGLPGTPQFALCGKGTAGSPTVTPSYVCSANSNFNFAASTTTTLASRAAPASSDTVSVSYLANISGSTPAGSYTTTLTYIATSTF